METFLLLLLLSESGSLKTDVKVLLRREVLRFLRRRGRKLTLARDESQVGFLREAESVAVVLLANALWGVA